MYLFAYLLTRLFLSQMTGVCRWL